MKVPDLAERAIVSRSTLYRHYSDRCDRLWNYQLDLHQLIDSEVAGRRAPPGETRDGLVNLPRHLQANATFYWPMLGPNGDAAFRAQSFRGSLEECFRSLLPEGTKPINRSASPMALSASFLLHASLSAIPWWPETGEGYSPEQVAGWLLHLSHGAISVPLDATLPFRPLCSGVE